MFRKTFFLLVGVLFSASMFAQDVKKPPISFDQLAVEYLPWLLLGVIALLAVIILWLLHWISELVQFIPKEGYGMKSAEGKQGSPEPDFISKFIKQVETHLTDAVPVEREKEIEFTHEYDGIRELDNSLPPWWKYLFYLSIVFAVVYLYRYHISHTAPLSLEEYKDEIVQAEIQKATYLEKASNLVNESSVTALTQPLELSNGKRTYIAYCVACHGALGEGGVGPNLTDQYWLHGGGIKDIFKTVKYGWPEKGMIAWQTQLRPREMQEVSSYILTLQGTNPPNAKAPQGDPYAPDSTVVN